MRAARDYGGGVVRIEDVDLPPILEDEVRIEVEWAGICGSDKHGYERKRLRSTGTMGHEFSGAVVEIGDEVTGFKPGDRVVVNPLLVCGKCQNCLRGYHNLCENLVLFGVQGEFGAFSEQTIVKDYMLTRIPDNLPFDIAAMTEPACIGAHALRMSKFKPGDTVAVFGVGAIGLLLVSLLKASGCLKIIAMARTQSKLDLAKKLGADVVFNPDGPGGVELIKSLENSVDVAFELSEAQSSFDAAVTMLRGRGELVLVSLPGKPLELNIREALHKEINFITSQCSNGEFPMVVEFLANGSMPVEDVITKRIFLDDLIEEGIETLIKDSSQLKIMVTPKRENLLRASTASD